MIVSLLATLASGSASHSYGAIMFDSILQFGLIAGLIVGSVLFRATVAMAGHPPSSYGVLIGYTTMLVAFSAVFIGIEGYRDHTRGGVIRFWPAFGMRLAISLIAGICYVPAW